MKFIQSKDIYKPLTEHVKDLRKFLIISICCYFIAFGICFYFASDIYTIFSESLIQALKKYHLKDEFVITSVTEVFSTYIKLAFFVSIILFAPIFLLFLFIFLFPALRQKERKIFAIFMVLIPLLFFLGGAFAFFVAFGAVWDFFIKLSLIKTNIVLLPKVSEYITLVLNMSLAFSIAFELPVLLMLLSLYNIIDERSILLFSRYAIVAAFVIGAVLTPPDPLSQIIVATILLVLYYSSYFLIKLVKRFIL